MAAVESKIRELLSKTTNLTEETQELDEAQKLAPNAGPSDSSSPAQGSSNASPEMEDLSGQGNKEGGLTSPVGKAASAKASKDNTLPSGNGAGDAPNYETKGGKASGLAAEEVEADEEVAEIVEDEEVDATVEEIVEDEAEEEVEAIVEEDEALFEADIEGLFADEEGLTEDFKNKAASMFEAVVTARVTASVEEIQEELAEEARIAQELFKEDMVEKIDGYLNYVSENWMKENELAIERGLRTEITEDFISGMKTLFAEHYIEVPAEKYDVLGEMQAQIDELKNKLDESVAEKLEIVSEKTSLLRSKVIAESTTDLTVTESEKLIKLIEDVEFDSSELFAEKVAVIKENYFPKVKATGDDKMDDIVEGTQLDESSPVSIYAQAISKQIKQL